MNIPESPVVEPGNEIVEPTSDKVFQLQLGSYYSVQTTSEGTYHLKLLGWIVTMTMGDGSPYLNM